MVFISNPVFNIHSNINLNGMIIFTEYITDILGGREWLYPLPDHESRFIYFYPDDFIRAKKTVFLPNQQTTGPV